MERSSPIHSRWNRLSLYIVIGIGLFLFTLTGILFTKESVGADSPGCRMVWMGPSYARISGFDESHSKFASKYSLYLYREQDRDNIPEESDSGQYRLDGVPVLFIPGNAGSYRQIRSIASESANLFFDEYIHRNPGNNPNSSNLDFFAADFNEDFTAFHGRTMLDQAEYANEAIKFILDLYSTNKNPPKSVIVVAHSMGGIVSRVMVTLGSYLPDSINTIITLSSPHAAAPLTFDGDLLQIYSATDRFWYEGYHADSKSSNDFSSIAKQRLENLSLISITGGLLDNTLPADYTTLGFLVPPSNGFTVYSTGIPSVWTPIDHLAVVWCSQLRNKVSRALLDIVDVNEPHRTVSLQQRMKIFRSHLLTGFEPYAQQDLVATNTKIGDINLKLDVQSVHSLSISGDQRIKLQGKSDEYDMNLFQLPNEQYFQFSLLSSIPIQSWDSRNSESAVLLCKKSVHDNGTADLDDFTTEATNEFIALNCVDIHRDAHIVPRSNYYTESLMDSSYEGPKQPFYAIRLTSKDLANLVVVVATKKSNKDKYEDYFLFGEVSSYKAANYEISQDALTMFIRGAVDISLPTDRPLAVNVNIPGAWSSILAYKLYINGLPTHKEEAPPPFTSFARQWIEDPYETKWHINLEENPSISLSMHGIAPYVPFRYPHKGLNLELWSAPSSESSTVDIIIRLDLLNSLRLLVLRYRLAIVAGCVSVSLLVMMIQIRIYARSNRYPTFVHALTLMNSGKSLMFILFVIAFLTPLVCNESVQRILNLMDPVVLRDWNEINMSLHNDFKVNSFYLGLEEKWLWPVGIVVYLVCNFLVFSSYYLLISIGFLLIAFSSFINRLVNSKFKTSKSDSKYSQSITENYSNIWSRRGLVIMILLAVVVPFYAPYQLVYIICFVVQIISVLKVLARSGFGGGSSDANLFNFQVSMLILMLWILPVNVPILIVFVHNVTVNWSTPFSSHHNFFSIFPILALVERNSKMQRLPKFENGNKTIEIFMGYTIFYCLIYGVRHTFWIHHLFNVLSCLYLRLYTVNDTETDKQKA